MAVTTETIDKYLAKIKNATSKEELQQISFNFLKNEDVKIMSRETHLIDGLCVYKEYELKGSSKDELAECVKVLKLPKSSVKKIAR